MKQGSGWTVARSSGKREKALSESMWHARERFCRRRWIASAAFWSRKGSEIENKTYILHFIAKADTIILAFGQGLFIVLRGRKCD
jgi:hypothetical protein